MKSVGDQLVLARNTKMQFLLESSLSSNLFLSPLLLGLIILVNSLAVEPLKAQLIDSAQRPDNGLPRSAPVPLPQNIQPPTTTPVPEPELPPTLSPPQELLQPTSPTPETPEIPEAIPSTIPQTITVERFDVVGSTVFSAEELAAVTAPFTNRPLSNAELYQVRSAITQFYNDQGYITSGAYIPPQEIRDGVVTIQVIEGELEAIDVTGTQRLNPNYVRSRLAIATSKPLNVNRLLKALQLLQLDPLIENLSAELSAGTRPGLSLLDIQVSEADSFSAQIILDNTRVPSVGSFQREVRLDQANLLGFGDGLNFVYKNTDGSNEFDVAYTLPLNPRNGNLKLAFRTISSEVVEPPFDQLDIESDYYQYKLTLRQPVIQTPNQELALGLTFDRQQNETSLLGISFPLSPGADNKGRTRISTLRFFQEWTQRGEGEVIAVRSQFSFGIDTFNPTINQDPPDSLYFLWRGQAQWVRLLAPDTLLLARTDLQLADRPLVPVEQFGLGGLFTVRGYRQDALLTDNGVFASVELRLPIFREPRQEMVLQIVPFVDFGSAWNNSGEADRFRRINPDPSTLVSVGLGLRYQLGERLTARFDWGIPLVEIDSRDRTLQENGFYFSIIYNPF